ncbi:biliverdin-producing heme oxygenase [Asticcacaulis sp. SL142]|uniref:biliverdin-producing heme oxygenase n=1 Tax=Asticcacaulis sp. SL142 TaxID=2995155 RepID=UPI00226D2740|nr:biliverdin-producing heme oxygenase [Asticcacaulis sp. SL142]WAC48308.1 biliverdin-producing heme oxygenase [Asticcacaulis sp. SL142]
MNQIPAQDSRARRLKALTSGTHDRLDKAIMVGDPFANRANYAKFLKVQYLFHRDIAALYQVAELEGLLPDLVGRRRFEAVAQDLADLGVADIQGLEADPARFVAGEIIDVPTALGWLYVAEGSSLGAAFLLKFAAKLGLNAKYGARHLAPADEGRGLHWRTFTAALDSIDLTAEEDARVVSGAEAAFVSVHARVRQFFD